MIIKSEFKPAWWLPGPHLQTIWPSLAPRSLSLSLTRERIELFDGDFVDLDWTQGDPQKTVLVLHGLGGSIESPYAKGMMHALASQGYRGVLMHFRGCSGEVNRLPRSYHSGDTRDLSFVVNYLLERESSIELRAVGYSLGGNVLLKWLGETPDTNPLKAAVAVSVPFELHKAAAHIRQGFARFYQWWLLRRLRNNAVQKYSQTPWLVDVGKIKQVQDFWEFDDLLTAPLHGFRGVHDYYYQASARQYLSTITTPTLVLHARDDPFMNDAVIPTPQQLSKQVRFELSDHGGHVGFIGGDIPGFAEYWLEKRIVDYFNDSLADGFSNDLVNAQ